MKKITILCLHLGYGGIEVAISNLANMLIDNYDIEIVSNYNIYGKPFYKLDDRIKIKYLYNGGPNKKEFKSALKKLNIFKVIKEGFNQDEYETTAKEFEYYTLIEKPQEEQGKMKVEITKDEEGNDVVNNTIELYYYYEAKPFNIGVEKEITGIIVNGERRAPTSGKLEKVEIYRKSTEDTSVQVEYKIKVMNTGEVSGNATIEENIPAIVESPISAAVLVTPD